MIINNKIILLNKNYENSDISLFFEKMGLTLAYAYNSNESYLYIVDDVAPENINTPRLSINSRLNRSGFTIDKLSNSNIQKILHFHLSNTYSNDILEQYDNANNIEYSLKMQDYLNTGYLIDCICNNAFQYKINYNKIRSTLNAVFDHFIDDSKINPDKAIFDIVYTYSQEVFFVKIDFELNSSISDSDKDIVQKLIDKTNYLNLSFFEPQNRVILTLGWMASDELKNQHLYFTETLNTLESININSNILTTGLGQASFDVSPDFSTKRIENVDKLSLAKKLFSYLKNILKYEEDIDDSNISFSQLDTLLKNYPISSVLKKVDDEVRSLIIKLLKDPKFNKNLNDFFRRIAGNSLNPQIDSIKKIIAGLSLDDIHENILVRGTPEAINSDITIVKGWVGVDDDIIRISGAKLWSDKRSQILSLIDQEIARNKELELPLVEEDLVNVLFGLVEAPIDDIRAIVGMVVDHAISSTMLGDNIPFCLDLFNEKLSELEKKNQENLKLKQLVTRTMNEYKSLKQNYEGKIKNNEFVDDNLAKSSQLKIESLEDRLKQISSTMEKLKNLVKLKDSEINSLKIRLNRELADETKPGDANLMLKLKQDKKIAEDAQMVFHNELKKTETKLGLMVAQIDEMKKRKTEVNLELIEKKKEIHKLKNENNILNVKYSDLEKKISIHDKKVS